MNTEINNSYICTETVKLKDGEIVCHKDEILICDCAGWLTTFGGNSINVSYWGIKNFKKLNTI